MDRDALIAFAQTLMPVARDGRTLPRLWFLTDGARVADPLAVAERLPAGSGLVLRDYGYAKRAPLATALAAVARRRGLVFLVGGDAALAARVGADGVHLPERDLVRLAALRSLYPDFIVTAAAHGMAALHEAAAGGAAAAFVSPVFPTASHPGAPALGAAAFHRLAVASPLPVIALGGLTAATVPALAQTPLAAIAAIGALAA